MARIGRIESSTGIYHVMVRGINKQSIFKEDNDYYKYLNILKEYQEEIGFELYAYCLMNNHLHLLVKEGDEKIGNTMKRIGVSYVSWFNWQYNRSGHLFQGRFRSEPVEDESYFITLLRYIHQNPIKAGLVKKIEKYKWSSYNEYIYQNNLINKEFGLGVFSEDKNNAIKKFREYHQILNDDPCMDIEEEKTTSSDRQLKELVSKIYSIDLIELQAMEENLQEKVLLYLMEKEGASLRQLSRLTGMTVHRIYKIRRKGSNGELSPCLRR